MKKINLMTIFLVLGFIGIAAQTGLAQLPNPSQQDTNEWRSKGTCNDPWVSKAVSQVNASVRLAHTSNGSDGECDVSQYNNGQWGSFDQLWKAVDKRRGEMRAMGVYYDSYKVSGAGKVNFLLEEGNNRIIAAALVGNDGASLVAAGGGNLIGNDSAGIKAVINKLVAAGGGNLVAAGGGNLVNILKANGAALPTGGGNLSASQMASISQAIDAAKLISNLSISESSPGAYSLKAGERSVLVKMGNKYIRVKR